ncbi:hypothetical protein D210916BOD24_15370 [Alteromonas sp. D210916BOD_24]|uniref:hypothetical protein n=1 Tax=Alteromonas sp. D210916BOD_24 TaxID=3157618 RepID=UPI00399C69B7
MLNNNNSNRTKYLQSQLPLVLIIVVAIGVYFVHKHQSNALNSNNVVNGIGNSCQFVNKTCEFLIEGQVAVARFSEAPVPEESITVSISLPAGRIIESAWIEGINMYMGKIPVLLEKDSQGDVAGWFMLGSCSEPVMKWQLRLNVKGSDSPSYLYFVTES